MRVRAVIAVLVAVALLALAYFALQGGAAPDPTTRADPVIPAEATPAVIEYVHDGDTLFLTDGRKVRLLGVDTPEIGEFAECYGTQATDLLRSLLPPGTPVLVLPDVAPYDRYGRSLLLIYADDATLVNLELIEQGAAEAVVLKPNLRFAEQFEAAEERAQREGLGRWGVCR